MDAAESDLDGNGRKLCRIDVDEAAMLALILKAHDAVDLGEQSVVLAATDVGSGLERCAALPHDDAATKNRLTAEDLDSEPLRV